MNEHNSNQTEHKEQDEQPANLKQESNPSQELGSASSNSKSSKNTIAMLTYLVFFLPWLTNTKNDDFVKYHFRQSLGFLFTTLSLRGLLEFLMVTPSALCNLGGCGLSYFLLQLAYLAPLALLVYGIYNAHKGEKKPLWVIGEYADRAFKNL